MSFFSSTWTKFIGFLTPVKTAVVVAADPGLHAIETQLGASGLAAVQAGVNAAEVNGGTGAEKLLFAKKAIENTLKDAWSKIEPNIINLAIELAVAALKAAVPAI